MHLLGDLKNKPVAQMVDSEHVSVTVKQTDTALHAFNRMIDLVSGSENNEERGERLVESEPVVVAGQISRFLIVFFCFRV